MTDGGARPLIVLVSVTIDLIACVRWDSGRSRRPGSTEDFFMAGRNPGVVVTAFALFQAS